MQRPRDPVGAPGGKGQPIYMAQLRQENDRDPHVGWMMQKGHACGKVMPGLGEGVCAGELEGGWQEKPLSG